MGLKYHILLISLDVLVLLYVICLCIPIMFDIPHGFSNLHNLWHHIAYVNEHLGSLETCMQTIKVRVKETLAIYKNSYFARIRGSHLLEIN